MTKNNLNFDVTEIPLQFRLWVVDELFNTLENELLEIDDNDECCLKSGADASSLEVGTVKYGDRREAMVTFKLVPDYKKVTENTHFYNIEKDEMSLVSCEEITKEVHDMSVYEEHERKIGIDEIIRKAVFFVNVAIDDCANDVSTNLGTFISKDGREVLMSVSLRAEYDIG